MCELVSFYLTRQLEKSLYRDVLVSLLKDTLRTDAVRLDYRRVLLLMDGLLYFVFSPVCPLSSSQFKPVFLPDVSLTWFLSSQLKAPSGNLDHLALPDFHVFQILHYWMCEQLLEVIQSFNGCWGTTGVSTSCNHPNLYFPLAPGSILAFFSSLFLVLNPVLFFFMPTTLFTVLQQAAIQQLMNHCVLPAQNQTTDSQMLSLAINHMEALSS